MIRDLIMAAAANSDTAGSYRYWRFTITANNGSTVYTGFSEIELRTSVGGADITTPATPVVTLVGLISGAAANLVLNDGAAAGAYGRAANYPAFDVYISLAAPAVVRQVALMGSTTIPAAIGKDFTIRGSNDLTNWSTVKTLVNQTAWVAGAFNLYSIP